MYLAREFKNNESLYSLRESYPADGCLQSRELFQLGPDPGRFIRYPGGNAYYFDERLTDALADRGIADADRQLDVLLWDFLKPEIRRIVGHFSRRSGDRKTAVSQNPPVTYHLFDKRRILYLKTGQVDQGAISRLPRKLFRILDNKSRDEIEQYCLAAEQVLKPDELKLYTYVIFDLQRHFGSPLARQFPSAMGGARLDNHFIEDVCRLDTNNHFWRGLPRGKGFNAYLARYVAMYFDNDFPEEDIMGSYVRDFMNRRRNFRFPERPMPAMSLKAAGQALGLSSPQLKTMSPAALTRHYRKMAIRLHPDQGGDHDRFIEITEAYQTVLGKIRKRSEPK